MDSPSYNNHIAGHLVCGVAGIFAYNLIHSRTRKRGEINARFDESFDPFDREPREMERTKGNGWMNPRQDDSVGRSQDAPVGGYQDSLLRPAKSTRRQRSEAAAKHHVSDPSNERTWSKSDDKRCVTLLYATNRRPMNHSSRGVFTGERAKNISFGRAVVRVPEAHRLGKVEQPFKLSVLTLTFYEQQHDINKHFTIAGVEIFSKNDWCHLVATSGADEALVFVHGFNNSFDDALYRCAQIVWDLQFSALSVLFSWPSRGRMADYLYDRESAIGARDSFIECLSALKAQPNIKKIHILAHSMGNQVVLESLAHHRHDIQPLGIAELMMAAPDVDSDVYCNIAAKVRSATTGMTLYASSADKALALSKKIAGAMARAGDVPIGGPIILPGIDSIDVTALGDEPLGLNHGTFAQSRSVLNDVNVLIRTSGRPPNKRLADIRSVPEGSDPADYWRYSD